MWSGREPERHCPGGILPATVRTTSLACVQDERRREDYEGREVAQALMPEVLRPPVPFALWRREGVEEPPPRSVIASGRPRVPLSPGTGIPI